ncbi:MAG: hypothetical protein RIR25_116, partial [Verrucomicrobiota bacterium]
MAYPLGGLATDRVGARRGPASNENSAG